MQLNDFHYHLPPELIARYPLARRSASRLLYLNPTNASLAHCQFEDILDWICPGDLLVFNDTKVIPARLLGKKQTGGRVEVLVERILDSRRLLAQIYTSKPPRPGMELLFAPDIRMQIIERQQQFYELSYDGEQTILEMIEAIGQIPLPPYMQRAAETIDNDRYQTVYAEHKGSVAAPTAGLHFDEQLLQKLRSRNVQMGYLTLHIGAGTFLPVRVTNITEHKMHAEYFVVSEELCKQIQTTKSRGNRVIAVGTTSLRALETACYKDEIKPYQGETHIFIYPGYTFHSADALITNLHLPSSTLLMLVCAFGGYDLVMHAYREAVQNAYRFYSYGDAMWIEKNLS